jgi:hypothetical protein
MKGPLNIIEDMHCDGGSRVMIGCLEPVIHGLRIHVPSRTQDQPGHDQVRITLALHSCATHRGTFRLDDLLVPAIKVQVEQFAKRKRPIDWKPDFDAAFLQYVDIFSKEYSQFLMAVELHAQDQAEQMWGAPIHG